MTGLAIRFTAGRFHATPWGRHVNEGIPEWPPSPWRLLRSLVATWKRKLDDQVEQERVREMLSALLDPPEFVLPPAATGHSRHYMPWFKRGPDDRTLVFDTFVALPKDAEVIVLWPGAVLEPEQRATLALLAQHLQFLGRAESWCAARVLDQAEIDAFQPPVNCSPANGAAADGGELVRVLCADPERALANEAFSRSVERKRGRKTVVETQRIVTYNPDWHLCAETLWLHGERWSDPPGSRWVTYSRPKNCFAITPLRPRARSGSRLRPQVVRFALDSAVLPLATDTLPVAEAARRNLMGLYGRLNREPNGLPGRSDVLSGKDAFGTALEGHRHAFYLPTDEDRDGRLDHLTVVAEAGFGPGELRALDRLREIKTAEREASAHPLRVLLLGLGTLDDYRAGPLGAATVWESATPFIVTRHLKKSGRKRDLPGLWQNRIGFITAVLREELVRLIGRRPDLAAISLENVGLQPMVEGAAFRCGARDWRPTQYRRFRRQRGDDGGRRPAGAFRIRFPVAVRGPLALGHSAHFGMGLFLPC
jgi:CRISPR-associated protein Csb2